MQTRDIILIIKNLILLISFVYGIYKMITRKKAPIVDIDATNISSNIDIMEKNIKTTGNFHLVDDVEVVIKSNKKHMFNSIIIGILCVIILMIIMTIEDFIIKLALILYIAILFTFFLFHFYKANTSITFTSYGLKIKKFFISQYYSYDEIRITTAEYSFFSETDEMCVINIIDNNKRYKFKKKSFPTIFSQIEKLTQKSSNIK